MIQNYAAFVVGSVVVWGSVAAFAGLVYALGEAIGNTAWYRRDERLGGRDSYVLALACLIFGTPALVGALWACHAVGAAVLGGGGR